MRANAAKVIKEAMQVEIRRNIKKPKEEDEHDVREGPPFRKVKTVLSEDSRREQADMEY